MFHSTIRFEAKNGLIKDYSYNNFINIEKSTSYRQEYWMVSKRLDYNWNKKDNFLSKGVVTKNLKEDKIVDEGFSTIYHFDIGLATNSLRECDSIKMMGFLYNLNGFLVVSDNLDSRKKTVGKIKRILLANDNLGFKLELYDIVEFIEHINCFKIVSTNEISYRYFKNIVHKEPVNSTTLNTHIIIQIRHFFHILQ
jgi:hypothetical protein